MPPSKRYVLPVLAAVLVAVLLPIIFTGYAEIEKAESLFNAGRYSEAAVSFERAALFLVWRSDLREHAGIAAGASGQHARAIRFLERAPHLSEQGWVTLGYSYFITGQQESALQTYQAGLKEYPTSISLYELLALAHRADKNWTAERAALQNQILFDVENVYAHYRLGLLLTFQDPEQALPELVLASSLDPQFDPAVQTLRAALDLSATQPSQSAQMVTIGRALGLVNEWDLALAAFETAIEIDESNAEAWAWLGEAKQQTGQNGRDELDRAVLLNHQSVIVRALRGMYWSRQGKYEQMLAEYLLAAGYEPTNPAWRASIGEAYLHLGDLVSALEAYQAAADLAPTDSTYWTLLAIFCAENGVRVEDVGLPAAQKAVELTPDDPAALDALGWSYLVTGRFYTAQETLLDVITGDPNYLPARLHLAMAYLAQGNRAAAYEQLILVRDADSQGANGNLAREMLKRYFP